MIRMGKKLAPRPPLTAKSSRCTTCREYLERRVHVLAPAITEHALARDLDPRLLAIGYVRGVHKRHHAGLSLDTEAAA